MRLFSVALLMVASLGLAQPRKGAAAAGGDVKYKATTSYDFEDDVIDGDLTKPDGEYVEARKQVKHTNLIRVREEFRDKVLQSVGEL